MPLTHALHLKPTVEGVVEHNIANLHAIGQPIATIKAVHTGPNAAKASPEDTGGLQPVLYLAHGARVMLISNLWIDVGLVNGAVGTITTICYLTGDPPNLPIALQYILAPMLVQHFQMDLFPSVQYIDHGHHLALNAHEHNFP